MKQYHDLLRHVLDNGVSSGDRTGTGTTKVFGYQTRYDLSEGFPLCTTKKLAFRWIAEELFWFLSGSVNAARLKDKKITIWDEWATAEQCARFGRKEGDLGPVYGHCWRNFGASKVQNYVDQYNHERWDEGGQRWVTPMYLSDGVDQIRQACSTLENEKSRNSRRIIVSGWDPKEAANVALPPCHTLFQFVCHDDTLHCQLYQRSADAFLGVPYNIASYALLTHLLAVTHNLKVGTFTHTFGDLHIYNNHQDQVEEQLSRDPYPLPKLSVSCALGGGGFQGLMAAGYGDMVLQGYQAHPSIQAEVAV